MNKHVKYLKYLLTHKWYVFLACCRYGLYWQGIIHDWSKFLPDEWIPYANFFYLADTRKDRFYTPSTGTEEFNMAWLKHQHRNPHHWQYYLLQEDDGEKFPVKIPDKYVKEMLCDWEGAGRAAGHKDVARWYTINKHKMILHPETRNFVEQELGCLP